MQKYADYIFDSLLRPAAGASVLVRPTGGSSTSALYGDALGTGTLANPLTTDNVGHFGFYAANGRYDLVISGGGLTPSTAVDVMLEDVPLSNLGELSTASAARVNIGVLATASALSELSGVAATARGNIGAASGTSSQSFSGGQRGAVVTLASTGQITPDFSAANNFSLSMTANTTLASGTNAAPGQAGRVVITQNSTAKTLSYNSAFWKFTATATLSTATTAGTRDVIEYYIMDSTSAACTMRNGFAG